MGGVAPSDIQKDDVLQAIAKYDELGKDQFLADFDFGESIEYRLVYRGKFYDSKAIAGVAHGLATGEFWTKAKAFGGVGPGGAVTILRDLGFLVDDGKLFELTELKVDKTHGKPAPYKYVTLLWAMSRARDGLPRTVPFSDVREELADLLSPFAIAKSEPDPEVPWLALKTCSWWDVEPSDQAFINLTGAFGTEGGLSADTYQRVIQDDAFAGAAVDVIGQIIGSEPYYKPLLQQLGLDSITTVAGGKKPVLRVDWSWDEIVIVCDVMASNNWQSLSKSDPRIADLSEFLRKQPAALESEDFRSVGSISRKLEDIRSVSSAYERKATKGGKTTRAVVEAFEADPERMHKAAQLLWQHGDLARLADESSDEFEDEPEGDTSGDFAKAVEGRVIQRLVRVAERDLKLRNAKIDQSRKVRGNISCETCGFDFESVYGDLGDGFIHVHHVVPLHFTGVVTNGLDDLILLCANCHVMIHRRSPWKTPEQLREIIKGEAD